MFTFQTATKTSPSNRTVPWLRLVRSPVQRTRIVDFSTMDFGRSSTSNCQRQYQCRHLQTRGWKKNHNPWKISSRFFPFLFFAQKHLPEPAAPIVAMPAPMYFAAESMSRQAVLVDNARTESWNGGLYEVPAMLLLSVRHNNGVAARPLRHNCWIKDGNFRNYAIYEDHAVGTHFTHFHLACQ